MFARTFLAFVILASGVLAAETHEIRLLRPLKAGDRFDIAAKVAFEDAVKTSFDGTEVEADKTVAACRLSGVLTVVEVTTKGLPKEIRLKLKSVECVLDGRPAEFFKNGDELHLRRDEPENETFINGEPADDIQAQVIESLLSVQADGEVTDEDIFGTTEKVAVGAEWPVNAKAVVQALGQNGVTGLEPNGVKGNAKLVRVGEFESQPALSLKMAAQIDGKAVRLASLPENVKGRRFHSEYAIEMDVPVDLTSTAGHIKGMVKMEVDATGTEEFEGRKVEIAVKIERRVASDLTATPAK
jgi:hypothetical protein